MITINDLEMIVFRQHRYASLRREMSRSATTREERASLMANSKLQSTSNQKWTHAESSHSWSSSVDSELATVGSFETEASSDDKQSFAVFNSASCDSRDEQLLPDAVPLQLDYTLMPEQQTIKESKHSNDRFELGLGEVYPNNNYTSETECDLGEQRSCQQSGPNQVDDRIFKQKNGQEDCSGKSAVNVQAAILEEEQHSMSETNTPYRQLSSLNEHILDRNSVDEVCSVSTTMSEKREHSNNSPQHLSNNSQEAVEEEFKGKATKSDYG